MQQQIVSWLQSELIYEHITRMNNDVEIYYVLPVMSFHVAIIAADNAELVTNSFGHDAFFKVRESIVTFIDYENVQFVAVQQS